ncbi:uncharacterized protein LOC126555452 [Aphis gossypii]|uniref:uncharacterized protein LOC126555452 n=1 Tax=Aphis gossypii TaxID=80765 RepID=UPI002158D765|nr:uncharacterized protein LOC126555452 [Aphis gossypii]
MLQYCRIDDFGKIVLKKEHNYYYQIMGQLRVTGRNVCYFVIHTNQWTDIQIIHFDNEFWESTMFNKLKIFYLECLLPEIVDPLYGKRMLISDIREPEHILNAQNKKKKIN